MAKLENWAVVGDHPMFPMLKGSVYGDSKFKDGTEIQTSQLMYLDTDRNIAVTLFEDDRWELGTIDPEFAKFVEGKGLTLKQYEQGVFEITIMLALSMTEKLMRKGETLPKMIN